jgi:polar amino acid transport system substrate-binding protein
MRKKPFYIICLVSTVILSITLASCGNRNKSASNDPTLNNIKKTKVLTVGTDATFPPFEYKSSGKYVGFDIDLVKAVAKKLGANKVKFVDTEFDGLIPALNAKKFDLIASAVYISKQRKKSVSFSNTYYPGGLAIMVNKSNDTIKDLNDLNGKKVAVQVGTKSVNFLQDKLKKPDLVKTDTNNEMFISLQTNKADAVVTGMPAAKYYAKSHPSVKVLSKPLSNEQYGYVLRKNDKQLRLKVNSALSKLKKDGEYRKIVRKWFGN